MTFPPVHFWNQVSLPNAHMGGNLLTVHSLTLMSHFWCNLRPFFGDLELCYGRNWNSFWKYIMGKVCTYIFLDKHCIRGLFEGQYILPSLGIANYAWRNPSSYLGWGISLRNRNHINVIEDWKPMSYASMNANAESTTQTRGGTTCIARISSTRGRISSRGEVFPLTFAETTAPSSSSW